MNGIITIAIGVLILGGILYATFGRKGKSSSSTGGGSGSSSSTTPRDEKPF